VAVNKRYPWVLLWVATVFCCLEAYSLFKTHPDRIGLFFVSDVEQEMFLLSDQKISFQSWVDYAAKYIAIAILLSQLREYVPQYRRQLTVILHLFTFYILDYFVFYNNPFAYIGNIPVSYTLFMLPCVFIVIGSTFYRLWRL
jgi:hypothetical protein